MNPVRRLLHRKQEDVQTRKRIPGLLDRYRSLPEEDRRVSWKRDGFRFIAEVKRASLSAGTIRMEIDPAALALTYENAGATAVSVLTEEHSFYGSLSDLSNIRKVVSLPLLQKDFILEEFQIWEARFYGASLVLLIARFLTRHKLESFLHLCRELKINALVEITDESDLKKLQVPVEFIGVNSRDLETLQIDTEKFQKLRKLLPDAFLIAESGIKSLNSLMKVVVLGYHGALIGEYFLRAENPGAELSSFVESVRAHRGEPPRALPRIKICGITSEYDAMLAIDAGADALGFIFAESPRRIDLSKLQQFRARIPKEVSCIGVFRGQTKKYISEIVKDFRLDIAQIYDPVELSVPTWNAHTAKRKADIHAVRALGSNRPILWDLKPEEEPLSDLWKELGREKVFALAGGLNPENVALAVSSCHPDWIDVARGVELSPGVKDVNRLNAFINAARKARKTEVKR